MGALGVEPELLVKIIESGRLGVRKNMHCSLSLSEAIVIQRNNRIIFSTHRMMKRYVLGGESKFQKVKLLVKLRIGKCLGKE